MPNLTTLPADLIAAVSISAGLIGLVLAAALVLDSLSFIGCTRTRRARATQSLVSYLILGNWSVFVGGVYLLYVIAR